VSAEEKLAAIAAIVDAQRHVHTAELHEALIAVLDSILQK
jgi:hypothetical protein